MRFVPLFIVLFAFFPSVPASVASGDTIEAPLRFHNEDCRPGSTWVEFHSGCSATLEGTLRATCDAAACDVIVDVVATGRLGASDPEPTHVTVRMLYFFPWDWRNNSTQGEACRAIASAAAVTCAAVMRRSVPFEDLGPNDEPCATVYLDVASTSLIGVQLPFTTTGVGLRTHTVESRDVHPSDTRPHAPSWLICRGLNGGLFIVESGWSHTRF